MPETFVLHLGLHKTATTALQDFLAGQGKALAAAGVRYVPLARMRSDVSPLMTSLEDGKRARLALFLADIRKPAVLFSDENILGSPGDLMQGALYPFARNRIATFCAENPGARIVLFLTLRAPSAFLASLYCEYLRHNPFLRFADYVAGYAVEDMSYRDAFGWLSELPGHVSVRIVPFEAERGGGVQAIARGLVAAACGPGHGVDFGAFPKAKSRAAFSAEELDLAGEIAGRAGARAAQLFLAMLDGRGLRFGQTRFAPLAPALAARLDARYDADLAAFAAAGHGLPA
ncbi:hypothetical protein BH23PSE1_BH23PSE1_01610 [soil metagenome]